MRSRARSVSSSRPDAICRCRLVNSTVAATSCQRVPAGAHLDLALLWAAEVGLPPEWNLLHGEDSQLPSAAVEQVSPGSDPC